jgi:hypothetical protein
MEGYLENLLLPSLAGISCKTDECYTFDLSDESVVRGFVHRMFSFNRELHGMTNDVSSVRDVICDICSYPWPLSFEGVHLFLTYASMCAFPASFRNMLALVNRKII